MHGAEYDEMCAAIDKVRDKFESVEIAEPMLGEVGSDATVINTDKEAVAKAVVAAALSESGYESTAAARRRCGLCADGSRYWRMWRRSLTARWPPRWTSGL